MKCRWIWITACSVLLIFSAMIGGCDNSNCDDCATNDTSTAEPLACADITTANLAMDDVQITSSALVTDDASYASYCLVQGKVNERTGIDGNTYAIGFEMRLPEQWNQRFLFQANGGSDGAVVPATGGIANASEQNDALSRGFAVLSTDAGHNGSDPANAAAGLAQGVMFGLDPQARVDYGYATTSTMTPIAKSIIRRHYGQDPTYTYLAGCSNGGRHAMVAASRTSAPPTRAAVSVLITVSPAPETSATCRVNLGGTLLNGGYTLTTLCGDSPDAYNDIEAPERVVPVTTDVNVENGIITLPPHAVSVIRQC